VLRPDVAQLLEAAVLLIREAEELALHVLVLLAEEHRVTELAPRGLLACHARRTLRRRPGVWLVDGGEEFTGGVLRAVERCRGRA